MGKRRQLLHAGVGHRSPAIPYLNWLSGAMSALARQVSKARLALAEQEPKQRAQNDRVEGKLN